MDTKLDVLSAAEIVGSRLQQFLADLQTIVDIDSGTFDKVGVDAVGAYFRDRYASLGAQVSIVPHDTYGDSTVVRLRGQGKGRVLLIGHLDTVYPAGTTAERPFRIEGDRAYGPGAADMKSGDLLILYALQALDRMRFTDYDTITVVHNSDEEIGSPSSKDLIRAESEQADVVFVLEAARENGDIVSGRKGIASCRLEIRGIPAHAGVNHERGRSALLELAHLIVALEGINGTVPGVTLNVGRVEAGDRVNVVPDYAFARFEIRAFELDRLVEAMEMAQQVVEQRTVDGTEALLDASIEHYPMHKSDNSHRLVVLAQELAATLGFSLRDMVTGGASDGNTAASAGRPVLDGLGPIGGGAHSPNEYLDITSVVPRTALLAGLVAAAGAGLW